MLEQRRFLGTWNQFAGGYIEPSLARLGVDEEPACVIHEKLAAPPIMRNGALQITASDEVSQRIFLDDPSVANESNDDEIVRGVKWQQIHAGPLNDYRRPIIDEIEVPEVFGKCPKQLRWAAFVTASEHIDS